MEKGREASPRFCQVARGQRPGGSPVFFFCSEVPDKTQVHNYMISRSPSTNSEANTSLIVIRVWHSCNGEQAECFVWWTGFKFAKGQSFKCQCMMFRAEGRLRFTYSSQTKTKWGWKHEGLAAGTEGGTMVVGLGNLYSTNETGIK